MGPEDFELLSVLGTGGLSLSRPVFANTFIS